MKMKMKNETKKLMKKYKYIMGSKGTGKTRLHDYKCYKLYLRNKYGILYYLIPKFLIKKWFCEMFPTQFYVGD